MVLYEANWPLTKTEHNIRTKRLLLKSRY